ncbi:hypothetical protein DYI23_21485 [Roseibium polysiphoniae]|uniref:Uncharacterized protein n=1 Tax=Roseibium polysiphoniae TaxID=2571221 RepID=A0A944CHK1_9HYPH|nr:hypothetical protein [Roseibium polysiphoniae]MBS8262804.1 hypothetical protein [Roseibium polysiphoniae]
MILDYLRSAHDHALGRPKTAFPTRYHYIEVLREDLARRNIGISRLGQHCLVLTDRTTNRELIVAVRYTTDRDLRLLAGRKQKRGSRIAFLIDDDYWAMLEDDKLRPDYRARLDLFLNGYFNQLNPLLDAVVAPSQQILARLPNLPGINMQPAHLSPSGDLSHFVNPDRIKMVFLGTSTHGTDFKKVAPGVDAALKANPRLHLTTLLGKRGEDLIPSGPQVTHMGDIFFPRFQRWLSAQRFHIGLAPYEPNPVNDGRSNLKFHQHALVGAAGLYTRTTPFLECVEEGRNGLILEHEPEAWEKGVEQLTEALPKCQDIASNTIEKCLSIGSPEEAVGGWQMLF